MRFWYESVWHPLTLILLPFSWLFRVIMTVREKLYRFAILKSYQSHVPIIVVGNVTVGGTGKTPMVIHLANLLQQHQMKVGIVTRGYGGKKQKNPCFVAENSDTALYGDEAVLLKQRTHCQVVVCVKRAKAVAHLLAHEKCDVIIADDGLQHYALARNIEIAMVDGVRQFGNQQLLPAGPLREPLKRLKKVDFIVMNQANNIIPISPNVVDHACYYFSLQPVDVVHLKTNHYQSVDQLPRKIHAVAGIGHPEKFFNELTKLGFEIIPHQFPDHHLYSAKDFDFADNLPILMTEKDAVKCLSFAKEHFWFLRVTAKIDKCFDEKILEKITKECI